MRRWLTVIVCCSALLAGAVLPAGAQTADGPPTGTAPAEEIRSSDTASVLSKIGAGRHDGYDRVVFEWGGGAPGYAVRYPEAGQDAVSEVDAGATLEAVFSPATAHQNGTFTFGPRTLMPEETSAVEQVAYIDDDGGRVRFELTIAGELPFRVVELSDPPRIAIDVAHAEPQPAPEPDPEPDPEPEPAPEPEPEPVPAPTEFSDDDGSVHESNIEAIARAGITRGCDAAATRFCPRKAVPRHQMASFLARALDLEESTRDFFTDDDGSVHEASINALAAAGITKGCDAAGTRYCMTGTVKRDQMASFLARGFRLAAPRLDYFVDDERSTHEASVNALAAGGVTGGCDELQTRFCGSQTLSRAEMATFLARALGLADKITLDPMIEPGDRGPRVRAAQDRLHALGYWLGTKDGIYGNLTKQAVMAFQKVQGLSRDGVLGPRTRAALAGAVRPKARSRSGLVMEIDKRRQVILMVKNGKVQWVFNTSTGTEQYYTSGGRRYLADTPEGRFRINRQIDGWRVNHLGRLYRPKYFHPDGIAIHGSTSVPAYPASHGCARVSMTAMDWLWRRVPIGSGVWVY